MELSQVQLSSIELRDCAPVTCVDVPAGNSYPCRSDPTPKENAQRVVIAHCDCPRLDSSMTSGVVM